ncbi:SDR family NAD(P)-dependent oxidoreductase [Tenggerimyces flavus]|uniref:SDR family NAD(P)-dependent oxidoreductase n=1 Tax=Tenggerimyces flavus TaxID=1708749 RepID=A0ABV7Y7U5_9ACTN|nr:SDR family NAD(P)-dependent oxidoreductase [Tenggerimyces flavus]MBM7786606.1 NAD(P)-dependent dehydrogenase (short-subunit alcohol dehydrogenase family) [Tenggerimyces flavus]
MRTIVITGGTDGIGRALAAHYLRAGERVVVVGRSRQKFDALQQETGGDARFIQADLSLVREIERVVAELQQYERIDALVLAASYVRYKRAETEEGLEHQFALFYLGRALLVRGLADRLGTVVNLVVPGAPKDAIQWNDLQLEKDYTWKRTNLQFRRANELLAVDLPIHVRYHRHSPGFVRTSFAGDVDGLARMGVNVLVRVLGTTVDKAIRPIIALIDDDDRAEATRLRQETARIVEGVRSTGRTP